MTKYEAIMRDIKRRIEERSLRPGEKLPSIRALAKTFQCSNSTVIHALQELETEHVIYSIPRSGHYVVDKAQPRTAEGVEGFDFATSAPNVRQFPYVHFQHCINQAINLYQDELFVYGTPNGLPSLIRAVRAQLESYQVFASERNIVITSGVQQALALLNAMPLPNGKTKVVVEQPGYHLFLALLKLRRTQAIGVERTARGIDLARLEALFQRDDVRYFYTMPRFHNPLGTSLSNADKQRIVELADRYDVYIIEDDYLADFEQDAGQMPMYYYDTNQRVIYLKSYSKIMFPGLRVGVAVLPDALVGAFQQHKLTTDIDSSMISQAALELYITSGMFRRHRDEVRESYISKSRRLYASLSKHVEPFLKPGTFVHPASVCMKAHIVLPNRIDMGALLRNLRQRHVYVGDMKEHYLESYYPEKIMKLNVSKVAEERIEEGVALIADELSRVLRG